MNNNLFKAICYFWASSQIALGSSLCNKFFEGKPWPEPNVTFGRSRSVVKLCQSQVPNERYQLTGKPLFATLYSTNQKIPLYTANKVVLDPKQRSYARPANQWTLFNRVSQALCNNRRPKNDIFSAITWLPKREVESRCSRYQAVNSNYYKNGMNLDRGHLSPDNINNQDREKQLGTYTLTNVAPQYASFNRGTWRVIECITTQTILNWAPKEPVYIMTGTHSVTYDRKTRRLLTMNGVRIPKYFWKAVCYPGNKQTGESPWGYAIIKENTSKSTEIPFTFSDYVTLKEFSNTYFSPSQRPFSPNCYNAPMGKFNDKSFRYCRSKC